MNDVNTALLDKIENLAFEKGVLEAHLADEKEKVSELEKTIKDIRGAIAIKTLVNRLFGATTENVSENDDFECARCEARYRFSTYSVGNEPFNFCAACGAQIVNSDDCDDEEAKELDQ